MPQDNNHTNNNNPSLEQRKTLVHTNLSNHLQNTHMFNWNQWIFKGFSNLLISLEQQAYLIGSPTSLSVASVPNHY